MELVRTYVADENKIEGPTKKFILSKKKEVTKNRGTENINLLPRPPPLHFLWNSRIEISKDLHLMRGHISFKESICRILLLELLDIGFIDR